MVLACFVNNEYIFCALNYNYIYIILKQIKCTYFEFNSRLCLDKKIKSSLKTTI